MECIKLRKILKELGFTEGLNDEWTLRTDDHHSFVAVVEGDHTGGAVLVYSRFGGEGILTDPVGLGTFILENYA